jgi:hypothetical protein
LTEPFSPPEGRTRRRVASRLVPVQLLTYAIVALTAAGLIVYFMLTER